MNNGLAGFIVYVRVCGESVINKIV